MGEGGALLCSNCDMAWEDASPSESFDISGLNTEVLLHTKPSLAPLVKGRASHEEAGRSGTECPALTSTWPKGEDFSERVAQRANGTLPRKLLGLSGKLDRHSSES